VKSKVLAAIVLLGIIYLLYFLVKFISGPPNNPYKFKQKCIYYCAEWFHDKEVTNVVSTEPLNKHETIFTTFEIDIFKQDHQEHPQQETENELPPAQNGFINLQFYFNQAKISNSKGIYIQGEFIANEKNIELFKKFINGKGYIYISSPSNFNTISEPFIKFLEKHIASGSICMLDFTKTVHTSGSSILDNLKYLIQYDSSNVNLLTAKLKKQLEEQKKYEEEKKRDYQE